MAEMFKEYFRHDYHARGDDKIRKLRRNLGLDGYGLFWCLIEIMYEQGGYITENEIPDISFDLHTEEATAMSILNDFGLFIKNGDKYTSSRVVDTLEKRAEKTEIAKAKGALGAQKRWGNIATAIQDDSKTIATAIETDSKTIANKRREENNNIYILSSSESKKGQKPLGEQCSPVHRPSFCKEIIDYLNEQTNSNFRDTTKATQRLINARIKEKYTLDNFKTVISKKTTEWKDNPEMSKFLRPETLFSASHFESYLNEKEMPAAKDKNGGDKKPDINKAISIINNRRNQAELAQSRFITDLRKDKSFAEAESKVDGLRFDMNKAECRGQETAELKRQLRTAEIEYDEVLKRLGYSLSDLETKYTCQKCNDTGFINGQQCECLKKIMEG